MRIGRLIAATLIATSFGSLVAGAERRAASIERPATVLLSAERIAPALPLDREIGVTVQGRSLVATLVGDPFGTPVMAVSGIHGDEQATTGLTSHLLNGATIPPGLAVWVIEEANPDGLAANRRTNARGVDLNRNFATSDWRLVGSATSRYSGATPASEPETMALQQFIGTIRPRLLIWWHEVGNHVDDQRTVADYALLQRYAALAAVPIRFTSCGTPCVGNATVFANESIPGTTSFVVELPSTLADSTIERHAEAFLETSAEI